MEMNALLSTFHDAPAMLHPGMQNRFEAFLRSAQVSLTRIEAPTSNVVMQDDFWPAPDSWLAAYRPYIVKDEILMIPVKGVLLFGVGYAIGDYATGYVYLTKALERGLADPQVKGIAFIIDSPGGHVAGNFDLADKIFNARGQKPIHAFAAENAYSAAYSIASACRTVTVARTGGVGSIGVVTVHLDASKAMDGAGLKVTFIHYGKHKVDGNAYEALPADVKDRIQARIDNLGELFVSTVARNRAMDPQAVRDTEALTFGADEAVSIGLADKVGVLDGAIADFASYLSGPKEDSMTTKNSMALQSPEPIVRAQPLSKAEQALRDAGFPPRSSYGTVTDKSAVKPGVHPSLVTDGNGLAGLSHSNGRTMAKIEQALEDAGFKPKSATSSN
ncbi:hypothetical protein BS630_25500 [Rhizobium laguerreae]|nr:hypothetical protein BS630_25500 [Rhizobium laguerreae]